MSWWRTPIEAASLDTRSAAFEYVFQTPTAIRPTQKRAYAEPPKERGAGAKPASASPNWYSHLALGDDRRWSFTFADVASAARDAEESKHRSRC
jgi:hypothetical protein